MIGREGHEQGEFEGEMGRLQRDPEDYKEAIDFNLINTARISRRQVRTDAACQGADRCCPPVPG